jgi:hypothetical protein
MLQVLKIERTEEVEEEEGQDNKVHQPLKPQQKPSHKLHQPNNDFVISLKFMRSSLLSFLSQF